MEASLGLSFDGEHSDSVMPATNALISRLKLNEGSGLYAAAGYLHRIPLDRHWSAFAGGQFEFRSESYDLTATVFDGTETILVEAATGDPGESAAVPGADPDGEDAGAQPSPAAPEMIEEEVRLERNVAKSVDLQDLALSLRGGITYEADAWGVRLEILLCVWDDTAVDGSVEVLAEDLKLDGSRSHPLTVSAAAWCYVLEGVWTEAKCTFGAETALRLGVGYEW